VCGKPAVSLIVAVTTPSSSCLGETGSCCQIVEYHIQSKQARKQSTNNPSIPLANGWSSKQASEPRHQS
jgi:hypothetical protein